MLELEKQKLAFEEREKERQRELEKEKLAKEEREKEKQRQLEREKTRNGRTT